MASPPPPPLPKSSTRGKKMTGWRMNAYYCLFPPSEPPPPYLHLHSLRKCVKEGEEGKKKHKTATIKKRTKNEDRKKNGETEHRLCN